MQSAGCCLGFELYYIYVLSGINSTKSKRTQTKRAKNLACHNPSKQAPLRIFLFSGFFRSLPLLCVVCCYFPVLDYVRPACLLACALNRWTLDASTVEVTNIQKRPQSPATLTYVYSSKPIGTTSGFADPAEDRPPLLTWPLLALLSPRLARSSPDLKQHRFRGAMWSHRYCWLRRQHLQAHKLQRPPLHRRSASGRGKSNSRPVPNLREGCAHPPRATRRATPTPRTILSSARESLASTT